MDPKVAFVCYLLAFICFVVDAFWRWEAPAPLFRAPRLISLGLAFVDLVLLVNTWKAL